MAFILLLAVYIRTGTNVYPCPFPLFRSSPMLKNVDPVVQHACMGSTKHAEKC
jgi:hypothetical protein